MSFELGESAVLRLSIERLIDVGVEAHDDAQRRTGDECGHRGGRPGAEIGVARKHGFDVDAAAHIDGAHVKVLFAKETAALRRFEDRETGDGLARITDDDSVRSDAALAPRVGREDENDEQCEEKILDSSQHDRLPATQSPELRNNRSQRELSMRIIVPVRFACL